MAQAEYVNNAIRVPITGAGAGLPTSPIKAAHAKSVAVLTRSARRHIACSADPIKLKASAVQLNRALSIVSVDGAATLECASRDLLGGLHLSHIGGLLCDLSSEMGDIAQRPPGRVARRVQ